MIKQRREDKYAIRLLALLAGFQQIQPDTSKSSRSKRMYEWDERKGKKIEVQRKKETG